MSKFDRDIFVPEIIIKIRNAIEDELRSLFVDVKELEDRFEEELNKNEFLINKILELETKNKDLNNKLKSKSSSSIWENMQIQLHEKDKQIEEIKKELDFYKRNYNVKNFEGSVVFENKPEIKNTKEVKESKKEVQVVSKAKSKSEDNIEASIIQVEQNEQIEPKEEKVEKAKKKKKSKSKKEEEPQEMDDLEKELMGLS